LAYIPTAEASLEEKLREHAGALARAEMLNIHSTMSIEGQAPSKEFTDRMIKERAEDIIRSGNWKEIWQ
jgi:hypothetical protein